MTAIDRLPSRTPDILDRVVPRGKGGAGERSDAFGRALDAVPLEAGDESARRPAAAAADREAPGLRRDAAAAAPPAVRRPSAANPEGGPAPDAALLVLSAAAPPAAPPDPGDLPAPDAAVAAAGSERFHGRGRASGAVRTAALAHAASLTGRTAPEPAGGPAAPAADPAGPPRPGWSAATAGPGAPAVVVLGSARHLPPAAARTDAGAPGAPAPPASDAPEGPVVAATGASEEAGDAGTGSRSGGHSGAAGDPGDRTPAGPARRADATEPVASAPQPDTAAAFDRPRLADAVQAALADADAAAPSAPVALSGEARAGVVRTLTLHVNSIDYGPVTIRLSLSGDALSLAIAPASEDAAIRLRDERDALVADLGDLAREVDVALAAPARDAPLPARVPDPAASQPGGGSGDPAPQSAAGRDPPDPGRPGRGPFHDRHPALDERPRETDARDRRAGDLYV